MPVFPFGTRILNPGFSLLCFLTPTFLHQHFFLLPNFVKSLLLCISIVTVGLKEFRRVKLQKSSRSLTQVKLPLFFCFVVLFLNKATTVREMEQSPCE